MEYDDIRVVSTDVFDTLLLRTSSSERSRRFIGESRFSDFLAGKGHDVSARTLVEARTQAQRWAFRALELGDGGRGEVRLRDLVERQVRALGLPLAFVDERMRIESSVEKDSLVANHALSRRLRAWRSQGKRIVATSDTTLPAAMLKDLVDHFHGPDLLDRIYSSADEQATKREGGLFDVVAEREGVPPAAILHMGDDERADVRVPARRGLSTLHLPRPPSRHYARLLDGAAREVRARLSRSRIARGPAASTARSFGHDVFGPIVAEFCLRIWLYVAEAERHGPCRLLFCARGGIGIREAFERVVERLELPIRSDRGTLLVSRLVAARSAVATDRGSAFEELGREFRGDTLRSAALALAGTELALPSEWDRPFERRVFRDLLASDAGQRVLREIHDQDALFRRHLESLSDPSDRLILCDTGLYGSTQRMLSEGLPSKRLETIQFARANYKGHGEEHFPRVAGLLVERRTYDPLTPASCVLRYWQLIESLFEPKLPSVRRFRAVSYEAVEANCGPVEPGEIGRDIYGDFLLGALAYIDALPKSAGGAKVVADAEIAWGRLRQAIARPSGSELGFLDVGIRSVDFGRSGAVETVVSPRSPGLLAGARSVRKQLWREGAIARAFPQLRHVLLPALDAAHILRGLRTTLRRSS